MANTSGIWETDDCHAWLDALDSYTRVIEAQGNERLVGLDEWYRGAFPKLLVSRDEPYITLNELERVASWKMTRGTWRERNRVLIRSNSPESVEEASRKAFADVPDPRKPVGTLSALAGVGPATASAVLAAYDPDTYPFFDDLVAAQIPQLGPVAFTLKYYVEYAAILRKRAARLTTLCKNRSWTTHNVAQALWAASGGKAAMR